MDNAARTVLLIACLAFIALGCATAAIGPLLPQLAGQTGTTLAGAGAIFTALSFGMLIAQLVAGPTSDRRGQKPVLVVGMALMVLGLAGVCLSRSLPALLAFALVAGFGQGGIDIGCNLLIATTFARRNVAALSFLHLFFGIGSVLGPAAVSLSLAIWATGLPALGLAAVLPLLLLPLTFRLAPVAASGVLGATKGARAIYRSPLLWAFAGLLGVYVGIEIGLGGWTTTYLGNTTGMALETAALVTSGYWLALSVGRLISTLLGTRLGPYTILGLDLAGTCLASFGLIVSVGNRPLTVAATLLMGLSFGSIYPTVMALVTTTFKAGPGKAASVITSASSLAGMLLPWLQGVLLTGSGPSSMVWYAAICCGTMVMLFLGAQVLNHQRPASVAEPGQDF